MLGSEQIFMSHVETCEKLLDVVDFARLVAFLELDAVNLLKGLSKGDGPIQGDLKYDIIPE